MSSRLPDGGTTNQFRQDRTMANILLAYTTTHGHTEKVVSKLASAIEAEGVETESVSIQEHTPDSLDSYDAVIAAASIHVGVHQKEMVDWISANRSALDARPNTFISVSMTAADDSDEAREATREYLDRFESDTGWKPARFEAVAGAIQYREYNVFTRVLMKMMMKKGGYSTDASRDEVFTDWDAVEGIGFEMATRLNAMPDPT